MNNKSNVGFADNFKYGESLINYEVTEDNKLRLYVSDCAIALGMNRKTIRWDRVYKALMEIKVLPTSGDYKSLSNKEKNEIRNKMKVMTITERELYLWSFKVDNEKGKLFREWLATTVLPNLREHGFYMEGMESMTPEEIKLNADIRVEAYVLRKFGIGVRKDLTATIQKVIKPMPCQGHIYAQYTNIIYRVIFGMNCKEYKDSLNLTAKDSLRDYLRDNEGLDGNKKIDDIGKTEDFMHNLLLSGITSLDTLENLIKNWYKGIK